MTPNSDDIFAIGSDEALRSRVSELAVECAHLQRENEELRRRLGMQTAAVESFPAIAPDPMTSRLAGTLTNGSSAASKISLFRMLFRGRDDVFAVRWIGKDGKAGYSPAAHKDWSNLDAKGRPARTFLPLTDDDAVAHLTGRQTIGVYPLLSDETCWFLAADFDKTGWLDDARTFLGVCDEWGFAAVIERSRSGHGGHVWMFFAESIPAVLARKLGAAVLTRAMERRHQLGLDSYDRFFPNQDTMPKGGFGNLIALPLQHAPRQEGNSVFLDENFVPFGDQWAFLSGIARVAREKVENVVADAERAGGVIGLRLALTDESEGEDPWLRPPSRRKRDAPIEEPLPREVRVVRGDLVYVEKEGLPSAMLNRLLRLAAFQNPEFYRAQAMRLSTFGKPRIIRCGEELERHIGLPRGCFTEVVELLKGHGVTARVQDERFGGRALDVSFRGELRDEQAAAAEALLAHDDGVLAATTAFGKTVIAAHCIARRAVNTLVLVHRRQLLDQWRERLSVFLGIDVKAIGVIAGGKKSPSGTVDIALLQSLSRKGEVPDFVGDYGHVVVDECHHLSAFSFETVLRRVKARFVLGLTANPSGRTDIIPSSSCSADPFGIAWTHGSTQRHGPSITSSFHARRVSKFRPVPNYPFSKSTPNSPPTNAATRRSFAMCLRQSPRVAHRSCLRSENRTQTHSPTRYAEKSHTSSCSKAVRTPRFAPLPPASWPRSLRTPRASSLQPVDTLARASTTVGSIHCFSRCPSRGEARSSNTLADSTAFTPARPRCVSMTTSTAQCPCSHGCSTNDGAATKPSVIRSVKKTPMHRQISRENL